MLLTVLAFIMGWVFTEHGPYELMHDWGKGFWTLLAFAMQMCLLMLTGFCMVESPLARRAIIKKAFEYEKTFVRFNRYRTCPNRLAL